MYKALLGIFFLISVSGCGAAETTLQAPFAPYGNTAVEATGWFGLSVSREVNAALEEARGYWEENGRSHRRTVSVANGYNRPMDERITAAFKRAAERSRSTTEALEIEAYARDRITERFHSLNMGHDEGRALALEAAYRHARTRQEALKVVARIPDTIHTARFTPKAYAKAARLSAGSTRDLEKLVARLTEYLENMRRAPVWDQTRKEAEAVLAEIRGQLKGR